MLLGCFEHKPDLFSKRSRSEQEDHDQGVREAHFGTVDSSIASGFENGEKRGKVGVKDDGFQRLLGSVSTKYVTTRRLQCRALP